ncbi:C40 family peptidase [Yinghuangia seranimata]|uniref:C40 family peptidase n=1 Tax=Yinghuangia seranimata TaxID=408067 RepID=UPI00248ACC20|nr:C40 family peptidase [Yinghuangia seranimata]MDI2129635.1 C40 family peptidase [Yinghuangia seranimata]
MGHTLGRTHDLPGRRARRAAALAAAAVLAAAAPPALGGAPAWGAPTPTAPSPGTGAGQPADGLPAVGATPTGALPTPPPNLELLRVGKRVAELAKALDEAGERATKTRAAADAGRARLTGLQEQQAVLQDRIASMKDEMGQLAAIRYRSAGFSPTVEVLMRGGAGLHMGAIYERVAAAQTDIEKTYTTRRHELDKITDEARRQARQLAEEQAAADRDTAALRAAAAEATRALTGMDVAGLLGGPVQNQDPVARAAVRFAIQQIGLPYVWGATGPDSYDCSGLTQRAWEDAKVAVPRTSQEQWAELPRVPLDQLRPGDLVVYFPEATHIAMYLGAGMIVHAPRPGRHITTAPLTSMPILGAVRPDGVRAAPAVVAAAPAPAAAG